MYERRGDWGLPFDRAAEAGFFPVLARLEWGSPSVTQPRGAQAATLSAVIRIRVSYGDWPLGSL